MGDSLEKIAQVTGLSIEDAAILSLPPIIVDEVLATGKKQKSCRARDNSVPL
jgi:hypothetical protein